MANHARLLSTHAALEFSMKLFSVTFSYPLVMLFYLCRDSTTEVEPSLVNTCCSSTGKVFATISAELGRLGMSFQQNRAEMLFCGLGTYNTVSLFP
jgi:hypothetical protein